MYAKAVSGYRHRGFQNICQPLAKPYKSRVYKSVTFETSALPSRRGRRKFINNNDPTQLYMNISTAFNGLFSSYIENISTASMTDSVIWHTHVPNWNFIWISWKHKGRYNLTTFLRFRKINSYNMEIFIVFSCVFFEPVLSFSKPRNRFDEFFLCHLTKQC